ncbi:T-cell surface glycoprotein CD3 gamma chain-like [Mantella aurantiaca]
MGEEDCVDRRCLSIDEEVADAWVPMGWQEVVGAKEQNENLWLEYKSDKCEWKLEGESIDLTNCTLDLGSQWEDPRGTYSCQKPDDPSSEVFLDVFVRKCQNCIKMDAATISGFVIADLIMIAFIGMAVYFVSGSETRRPGRAASDKQSLIGNDPNYQELGPRNGS